MSTVQHVYVLRYRPTLLAMLVYTEHNKYGTLYRDLSINARSQLKHIKVYLLPACLPVLLSLTHISHNSPHPPLRKSNQPAAVLSVVDMDDSRLSIELLLVACKLLRLVLRGLPETDGLAVEFDIATDT